MRTSRLGKPQGCWPQTCTGLLLTANGHARGLRDQIRRAAVSVASNIAEGYARGSDADFARFLAISRGSANEAKTQAYIALDLGYVDEKQFQQLYNRIDETCRMITGLMDYLRTKQRKRLPTPDCPLPTSTDRSNK